MSTSRRKFLAGSALSGLVAGFPLAASGAAIMNGKVGERRLAASLGANAVSAALAAQSEPDTLHRLAQRDFTAELKTSFRLSGDKVSRPIQVTLDQIVDFKRSCCDAATAALTKESFALGFRSGRDVALKQGVYTLTHARLGTFALLLVPARNDGRSYEAVINRLHV